MSNLIRVSTCVLILSIFTGCLKTRAQLKDDGHQNDSNSQPVPAQVQDVQPQGSYVIDELKSEITRLTGRLEDLERTQKQAASEKPAANPEEVKALQARIVELEQAQASMLEALKKMQNSAPVPDATDSFERGKNQFQSGSFDQSIENFSSYLKSPKGKHVEESTFLRAEAFYEIKQYKKAIIDYSKFPEKYTKSKKLPYVLYKIGLSFDGLGMKDDAKGFYQELVDKFPKSTEAKKAKAKLK